MNLLSLPFLLLSLLPSSFALSYHCADFSSLPVLEATGQTYTDYGVIKPYEDILASRGTNLARIRVWTAGDYNLTASLALAKRAVRAGMEVYVDLHFSDSWADPGKQYIPAAWPTNLTGLIPTIHNYTRDLVTAFAEQGTPITFIAIGNEINSGILWPVGEISVSGFTPLSQLLHSAATGVRAALSPPPKIMIHLANGWDWGGVSWWYNGTLDASIAGGLTLADIDTMGFSFYPFYGTTATLENLKESMGNVSTLYHKDFMVVETDWPANCTGTALSEPTVPISIQGQETWVSDIRNVLLEVDSISPVAKALGICYWEPGWIGNAALGSSCADNLLVTPTGAMRMSMDMFWEDM
ncbi:glycoside hydrolase family 53 protein [Jaapia argillacea MUCL 33604]|uniref:Arabinogalactan endo-beta-1,4-galactanase n=1 Tax=Jaapia argillacea MUCL 33604 TaxID=933084 RepID=A0A067PV34_9AGAM|nr:glycoside hydrolase family 53 protein [Jaapia argillacea MUCL 33604]